MRARAFGRLYARVCARAFSVHVSSYRGIDHGVFHVRFIRAGFEKPDENVGFDPIAVSLEDRVPPAEEFRQIAPWAARADNP
jgi:hypothetical protein